MSTLLEKASLVMIPSGYKEDVVYSEIPTDGSGDMSFTRSSDGTRVNSQGLVERVPWNLVQQSNTLNTTWSQINISVTSGQSGYDGSSDAWLLTTAASQGRVQQTLPTTSGVYTLSCYMKQGTNTRGVIRMNQGGSEFVAYFELDSGTAAAVSGNVIASAIESVGGGWYRCSAAFITATSSNSIGFGSAASGSNWTATTSGNIYIQDAQLVEGSTAKPYFPTTDRLNVPRLDYSNGCPSLLLEPQRTNLALYSEQFDNVAWTKLASTITANVAISPDGTQNADNWVGTNANLFRSGTTGVQYTISVYVKSNGQNKDKFKLRLGNDTSAEFTATSEWQRFTFTGTPTTNVFGLTTSASPNNEVDILVWGAQIEQASYPTSYIPTTSASVTRVADAAYKTGISSLIGQTEGTLFLDFVLDSVDGGNDFRFSVTEGALYDNEIFVGMTNGDLRALIRESASTVYDSGSISAIVGTRYKMALAYANNDVVFYVNGTQENTSSSATIPNTDEITIGNRTDSKAMVVKETINQAALFKTRLSNTDLASLTTL